MRAVVAAVFLMVCSGSHAQETDTRLEQAARCALDTDSLRRLTCFDRVFPAVSSGAPEAEEADGSENAPLPATNLIPWSVDRDKSSIDDSPRITAVLLPTVVAGGGIGRAEAALVLRCSENTTSVILSTSMFMTEDRVAVTTRVGEDPATTSRWELSTSYKAVGLWSGSVAIPFIKALRDNTRLVVRIEERERIQAEFDLQNVSAVAREIAMACNWPG